MTRKMVGWEGSKNFQERVPCWGWCQWFLHSLVLHPAGWSLGLRDSLLYTVIEGCHCLSCIGSLNFNGKRFGSKHLILEFDFWGTCSDDQFHGRHSKVCTGLDLCKEES